MKIFWSWQSDRSQAVCREFVKEALNLAAKRLTGDLGLDESEHIQVDHDTQGEAGWVDINATILSKIESATVFVADVTTVGKSDGGGKLMPNPNVLLELGYALKTLGDKPIILVANTEWGGSPGQLPFDMRHRRGPITYRLKRDAAPEVRQMVLDTLVNQLAAAIAPSLGIALEEKDAVTSLKGREPGPGAPALWFASDQPLRHRDWFGEAGETQVQVEQAPYSYARVIPAGWEGQPPGRDQVHAVPDHLRLAPLGRWLHGDGGLNKEGALVYQLSPNREVRHTYSATQWFTSGEIWSFDANATTEHQGARLLSNEYVLRQWASFLERSLEVADYLGSSRHRRIELGIVGLEGVRWPGTLASERVPAFDDVVLAEATSRTWDRAARVALLSDAYAEIRRAFGLPAVGSDVITSMLGW